MGNDRRTARTQKALNDALVALILRKDYESITVQDIIDEANVGRSTFYMHFNGKEDLLRASFETLRKVLAGAASAKHNVFPDDGLPFSLAMFEHACEHKRVYRALLGGRGGVVVSRQIRQVLADLVRRELARAPEHGIPTEIRVQFVVDTFLGVLSWSIGRKPGLPPRQMNAIFRRLAMHGLGAKG
jgi:AcrR family transcriptional regulator